MPGNLPADIITAPEQQPKQVSSGGAALRRTASDGRAVVTQQTVFQLPTHRYQVSLHIQPEGLVQYIPGKKFQEQN